MARKVVVELIVDEDGAVRGFRRADGSAEDFHDTLDETSERSAAFGRRVKAVAAAAAAAFGAMAVRAGYRLFELGTSIEETASKFETTFGDASDQVDAFIEDFGRLAGFTETEGREITATLGAMAQGFGLTEAASADFSQQAVRLAADLASFNNIPFEEALRALRSGLVGEVEPLRRFGINLDAATVKQRALAQSAAETEDELTNQEKLLTRLQIAFEQAGVQVGDLERTQDSTANQTRQLRRDFRQLREELAVELLPVFQNLIDELSTFADENGDDIAEAVRGIGTSVVFLAESLARLAQWYDSFQQFREDFLEFQVGGYTVDILGGGLLSGDGFGALVDPFGTFVSETPAPRAKIDQEQFLRDSGMGFLFDDGAKRPQMSVNATPQTQALSGLEQWMQETADAANILNDEFERVVDTSDRVSDSAADLFQSVRLQEVTDQMSADMVQLDRQIQLGVIDPSRRAAQETQILEQALTQMAQRGVDLTSDEVQALSAYLQVLRFQMAQTEEQARSSGNEMRRMGREAETTGQVLESTLASAATTAVNGLADSFERGASAAERMRSAASSILRTLGSTLLRKAIMGSLSPAGGVLGVGLSLFGGLLGRRHGGAVTGGQLYRTHGLGEREFFLPKADGRIVTAGAMRGAMQGAQIVGGRGRRQRVDVNTSVDARVRAENFDLFDLVAEIDNVRRDQRISQ